MSVCLTCGRIYEYKRNTGCRKNKCNSCYIAGNRRKRKEMAVGLFGGKCQKCGYSRSLRALAFHHVNASEKELNLSLAHTISWARYVKELNKCVLLCQNCHTEYHDGLWNIESIDRIVLGEAVLQIIIPTGRDERVRRCCNTKKCMGCGKSYETKGGTGRKFCSSECHKLSLRRAVRPSSNQLSEEMKMHTWVYLGRKYGVTDNAVKKWARNYNLI